MKSKEVFRVAVRILGLVFLYQALTAFPGLISGMFVSSDKFDPLRILFEMLAVAWPLILAYWLLHGAPLLMRIAYSSSDERAGHDIAGKMGMAH